VKAQKICTDLKHVKDGNTNPSWLAKWKVNQWRTANGKPYANHDLWKELDGLVSEHKSGGSSLEWKLILAHSSDGGNEAADKLTKQASGVLGSVVLLSLAPKLHQTQAPQIIRYRPL
jgi:ribonuclease HI